MARTRRSSVRTEGLELLARLRHAQANGMVIETFCRSYCYGVGVCMMMDMMVHTLRFR